MKTTITSADITEFENIINKCTIRYKNHSNYEDLKQEGRIAIMSALKTFNATKGNIGTWVFYYVHLRICRQSNYCSDIHIPLAKFDKDNPELPLLKESISKAGNIPTKENIEEDIELLELSEKIKNIISKLNPLQQNIMVDYLNDTSMTKICLKNKINKIRYNAEMEHIITTIREHLDINQSI
jgi:RNA polymerase sigma factor (sigma-70 family)